MNKHTPGPWELHYSKLLNNHFVTAGGSIVCDGLSENNARLIAAAPEMLETLRTLVLSGDLIPIPIYVRQLLNKIDHE